MSLSWADSEWEKMSFAENAREKGTFGFQGCVNYGNGCDFAGFYLAHYSKEGLCHECELKQFPERFHGCFFCRCAMGGYFNTICINCQIEFNSWALNLFYNKNQNSKTTTLVLIKGPDETNNHKFYDLVKSGLGFLNFGKMSRKVKEVPFIHQRLAVYEKNWPGFYAGDNKWIKPDPFELKKNIDISDITWDTQRKVLKRELLKLGINVFKDIQIKSI